ncbi:hypothetical protein [Bacillus wiedmannii]|uniref:hypothetical protein n=1 Tax=Bacillus wiedmannii TaxID=1890302 RepID=UPI0021D05B79|nr:hypothetical protein [Bacillus wiedmannii]MCU5596797.1 hypothetical protein [Bacillus wiedmannii]
MRQAYLYDESNQYIGPIFIESEDDIPDNATWISPDDGLYEPIIFNKEKEKWIGSNSPIPPRPEPPTTEEVLKQMEKEITEVQLAITEIVEKLLKESV